MKWVPFFFESNQLFDMVSTMGDWERLRSAYPHRTDDELLDAQEATYGGYRTLVERDTHPNYGFRSEHDGMRTLRTFFEKNGMLNPGSGIWIKSINEIT